MFPGGGIRLHTTRTSCHRKLQVWYLVEIMVIIEKNQQSESLLARWRFYSTACDACLSITWFVTRWKYSWVKCFFFPYLRFHRFDFGWKETSGREREIGRKKVRDPIIAGRGRIKIRDNLIFKHRDDPNIDRHGSVEAKHGIMSGGELFSTELYSIIREYNRISLQYHWSQRKWNKGTANGQCGKNIEKIFATKETEYFISSSARAQSWHVHSLTTSLITFPKNIIPALVHDPRNAQYDLSDFSKLSREKK